ncbi:NADH-quinone oxidoreductase subunit J [Alicyclobacillaceae bacterium I2511]|nr:NADH-quinone oxidoreductase subunit J [Alicyclobacillaceae bacterium I2511]
MNFVWNGPMIAFYVLALSVLGAGILMLSVRKVVYMALSIGGVFIGAAGIYILLGAEFVAVAQILIYVGAITILMMFAIMLTNHKAEEEPFRWTVRNATAAVGSVLLALVLLAVIRSTTWPVQSANLNLNGGNSNPVAIGLVMFKQYAFPFELVSLVLIVGLVGAVILAQERKEEE